MGVDAQVQIDRKLGPMKNRLIVGGEFLREETSRDITSDDPLRPDPLFTRSRQYTYGVFLQDELNLTEDLLLSAGVRFDYADYKLRAFDNDQRRNGPAGLRHLEPQGRADLPGDATRVDLCRLRARVSPAEF